MTPTPTPPQRESVETLPQYAARVLGYALAHGCSALDLEQLQQADQAAQRSVAALPMKLNPDQARLDATLHAFRHRVARIIGERQDARSACARLLRELYPAPADDEQPQQDAQGAPESESTRALRLLKAGLTLLLNPQDGGGGHGARLIAPRPQLPPGGAQARPQTPQRPTPAPSPVTPPPPARSF